MNWLNKKVAESPYKLAIIGGIVIALVASVVMANVHSWFPSFDSRRVERSRSTARRPSSTSRGSAIYYCYSQSHLRGSVLS